jgi:tetratricopeptide (TPR) repeat protein
MIRRIALVTMLLIGVAVAQPNEAERLYTEGQTAYDAKDYKLALAKWKRSYELSKLPALIFNIAQAERLGGDCTAALASYKKFVELDPTSSERETAEGLIKEIQPCPTPKVVEQPIKKPPPPPPGGDGHGKRIAAYLIGGAGFASVGVGLVFGLKAKSLATEVKDACASPCEWSTVADKDAQGKRDEKLQFVLYGVGGAALITSGLLYWLAGRERANAVTGVAVTPHADGAMITFSGTFSGSW